MKRNQGELLGLAVKLAAVVICGVWAAGTLAPPAHAQDTTPPTVVSVGSVDGHSVGVCFSEPVDRGTATVASNYRVNGGAPSGVTLRADGASVVLVPTAPVAGDFTVTVNNVLDRAGNSIAANSSANGTVLGLTFADIGSPSPPSEVFTCNGDTITVTAGGYDIWGAQDQFNFLYKETHGDFDVKVRVARLDYIGNGWSKAGLMARETLDPGSRNLKVGVNPQQGAHSYEVNARDGQNSSTYSWGGVCGAPYPNAWARLVRQADTFTAYRGTDGVNWEQIGQMPTPSPYPSTVLVGLTTCAAQGNGANVNGATTAEYSFVAGPPPVGMVNDNFANAIPLTEANLPFSRQLDTASATLEVGESLGVCSTTIGGTVWYSFTPAANMIVEADTFGSCFDTVLAAYTGTSFGDLIMQDCNDNSYDNLNYYQSRLFLNIPAGKTVHFQVGGAWGASGYLVFSLHGSAYGAAPVIVNPSFEADTFLTWPGYIGQPGNPAAITGWTSAGGVGINPAAFSWPFADNGQIPDGRQVAFMQQNGPMSQVVNGFTLGAVYQIGYCENARLWGIGTSPFSEAKIGGTTIVAAHAVSPVGGNNPYHKVVSDPFVATSTAMLLEFIKSNPQGGDTTLLIDNIVFDKDTDGDGIIDAFDSCPFTPNPDQASKVACITLASGGACLDAKIELCHGFSDVSGDVFIPGSAPGAPSSLVFEMRSSYWTVGDPFEFYLNDKLLGQTIANASFWSYYYCPPIQTFTVNDAGLISSAWKPEGNNVFRFVKNGSNTMLGWVRVRLPAGASAQTFCIASFDWNGACETTCLAS